MKLLFIVRQKKNVDSFRTTIARLLSDGHRVTLAIQERDAERDEKLLDEFPSEGFSLVASPTARSDDWRLHVPLLRSVRDWVQYLGPEYAHADKLRRRVVDKLRLELGAHSTSLGDGTVAGLAPAHITRLKMLLARIEAAVPSDPLFEEFVSRDQPDAVVVTPGVQFGSAQADFIKSAKAAGIPVWMIVFSWDNLSTKGALHVAPDALFVWNERQRSEAAELHGFPADRVIPVGAPRFDEFFELRPAVARQQFLRPLGLNPDRPTLLYVCSSRLVSGHEIDFIRRWLQAIRTSADPVVRSCNVIVRPHPDVPTIDNGTPETIHWTKLPRAAGSLTRPFDDPGAVVLRTTYGTPQAFFECLHHAAAVVGLNTSAELEAGIVGRPVLTVVADDEAIEGQASTLHFHYLLRENGGFVRSAPTLDEHVQQLADVLASPPDGKAIRRFIREFLRPAGGPASEVLAKALVERAAAARAGQFPAPIEPARGTAVAMASEPEPAVDGEPARLLQLGYPGSSLRIVASPETRRWRRHGTAVLDEATVAWLVERVRPGDVVYDIGAGVGAYALAAARHRGALTVAFEPGFATFRRLCENVLLNDCRRSVIPLCIALSDREALSELEYRPESPGEEGYKLPDRVWDFRRLDGSEPHYVQPVCVERLAAVVSRHRLPPPAHIRIAATQDAGRILKGAGDLLAEPGLQSLCIAATGKDGGAALESGLDAHGFGQVARHSTNRAHILVFARANDTSALRRLGRAFSPGLRRDQ